MERKSRELIGDELGLPRVIGIVSTDPGYSALYPQFIGPVFLAYSRPI